jgi:hypothetical protein
VALEPAPNNAFFQEVLSLLAAAASFLLLDPSSCGRLACTPLLAAGLLHFGLFFVSLFLFVRFLLARL